MTKRRPAKRSNLEILFDDSVSFDTACSIIADRQINSAPEATIEALMYSLRSGCAVLSRQDVLRRLAALDERQMRDCCARLQNRNPSIAAPWTTNEIEAFIIAWATCHA